MEATRGVGGGALGGENRRWWTLGAVSLGLFMIMLDNTVVNVALPSIERDLGLSLSELEWVVAGYALTFAAFMLTGGKLADLLGRRRVFVAGLVVFTAASLACGLAGSADVLIGARVVQGIGAAMMNPATLSIITATFPRGSAERRSGSGPVSRRSRSRSGRSSAACSPSTRAGAGSSSSTCRWARWRWERRCSSSTSRATRRAISVLTSRAS